MLKRGRNLFKSIHLERFVFNQINKLSTESKNVEAAAQTPASVTSESTNKPESNIAIKSSFSTMLESEPKEKLTFAKMFRHSKFVSLGDLQNKYLIGRVVDVVGDDLYIDYGGKFNCVCKRPEKNANLYQRNANVLIKLVDFEMASYFLSAAKHLTLLESNATLVGLYDPRSNKEKDERSDLLQAEINELNAEPIY